MEKIFTLLFVLACTIAYTQDNPKQSLFKNFVKDNYINFTDFGGLFGKSYQITPNNIQNPGYSYPVKASTNFTLQTFNGLKVYKNLAIGAMVGIDWFSNYQIIPIALGVRVTSGNSKIKKVKTFVGVDAGYGFMWLNDKIADNQKINGGLVISPMAGLLIPTGGNANFTLSIGYKHNSFNTKISNRINESPYSNEMEYNLNRMAVRLGVNF